MTTKVKPKSNAPLTAKQKAMVRRWIKALRSGKYKQVKGFLHTNKGYCCLGVLCDINKVTWEKEELLGGTALLEPRFFPKGYAVDDSSYPPITISELAAIHRKLVGTEDEYATVGNYLAELNDQGKSFAEIADWLEENLLKK